MNIEKELSALGLSLPALPASKGIFKRCLIAGDMLYVSGHISMNNDGSLIVGKLGKDLSDEEGAIAARQCGLGILASVNSQLGGFDKIKRVVKILGMVNSVADYENHPIIINGCSQLFARLWGEENGIGVRSAVGMGSLPGNVAVEIEAIFELNP
jgi:enamine deaminase RidA (YjgF/YER057c/UK114 family)